MNVKIQAVHFSADQKLVDFVNEKVNKLEQFHDHIISSNVYLKVDKKAAKENKIAEIRINIPGKELFAKKQCDTFEEAADSACSALERQVKKYKSKLSA